ncbi:MAG: hypothetical protein ACE5J0_01830 [Candidatus Paceibacterales bacterium]
MAGEFTKETVRKLMEIEGEVRGAVLKLDGEYVLREKGKEGLKKLESELDKMGSPIEYEKIKVMDFYPIGLRIISLLAIKEIFGLSDERIKEMGAEAPKSSLIIKLFMKYFASPSLTVKQAPLMWEKHYTRGKLAVTEFDVKEKRATLRLENLDLHPILCQYLGGYFSTVVKMVLGVPVSVRETKCPFRGDKYHEYFLKG